MQDGGVSQVFTCRPETLDVATRSQEGRRQSNEGASSSIRDIGRLILYASCPMHTRLACNLPCTHAASVAPPSRAALRARLASIDSFLSVKIAVCFLSTVSSQYPKLAPHPAKTGYAHSDPRLKSGRISRPSCHSRVATPKPVQKRMRETMLTRS